MIAAGDDGEGVDLLVLAVALVVVGIEVADECAFDDRLDGIFCLEPRFRGDEGKAAHALGFERSDGSAGKAAQFERGKILGFAAAQKQQPLGFQFRRTMQQRGFESFARHFAAGDYVGGRVFDGGVGGFNRDLRFVFFAAAFFRFVEHDRDQAFGFHFSRIGEGKISFHVCGSSIVGGKGIAQEAASTAG